MAAGGVPTMHKDHTHDHDHDHQHGSVGHNHHNHEHLHSHTHGDSAHEKAEEIKVLTTAFVDGFRLSEDNRMLFGGGESYGYKFPKDIAATVRKPMLEIFPQLKDTRIDYAWGGTLERLDRAAGVGGARLLCGVVDSIGSEVAAVGVGDPRL